MHGVCVSVVCALVDVFRLFIHYSWSYFNMRRLLLSVFVKFCRSSKEAFNANVIENNWERVTEWTRKPEIQCVVLCCDVMCLGDREYKRDYTVEWYSKRDSSWTRNEIKNQDRRRTNNWIPRRRKKKHNLSKSSVMGAFQVFVVSWLGESQRCVATNYYIILLTQNSLNSGLLKKISLCGYQKLKAINL